MTVVAKMCYKVKKPNIISAPLVDIPACDEEKIDIQPDWPKRSPGTGLFCMLVTALLLAFSGFTVGIMLYEFMKPTTVRRYQGFCAVMIPGDVREGNVTPWSGDPDVQIISTRDDDASEEFVNALREELDISNTMEKISVVNNGHRVEFIHDFSDNTSGIVDEKRCFIMDLEPELVLSPDLFISGLEHGGEFDVSRVRSSLRAALPAIREYSHAVTEMAARCFSRPIYRLYKNEDVVIRKRSADDPQHDYMHFAGKHVQEIKIDNLAEILEHEKSKI